MFASQPCLPYSSAQSCPSVSLTEDDGDDDEVDEDDGDDDEVDDDDGGVGGDDDNGGDILAVNE